MDSRTPSTLSDGSQQDIVEAAAERLLPNRLRPGPLGELPSALRPPDEITAYRVQDALAARLSRAGWGEVSGYKIGCTTQVMQRFLDIDHPCAGHLHQHRVHPSPAIVSYHAHHRLGVECELAVRIGRDIDANASTQVLESSIAAFMAAIELVDARYQDYTRMSTPTLIADDFFQAGAVLGPETSPNDLGALDAVAGHLYIDGSLIGSGHGRDILGHPLHALAWLADALDRRGRHLRRGEVVLLGSVVATQWIDPPSPGRDTGVEVEAHLEGLGRASVRIVA